MSAALLKIAGGAALAAACATAAQAQIYRCSVKGVPPAYQSIPCPAGAEVREIPYHPSAEESTTRDELLRLEWQFLRRRQDEKEQEERAAEEAAVLAVRLENCAQAKAALIVLEVGARVAKVGADGEKGFLADAEIEARKPRARASVQSWCD